MSCELRSSKYKPIRFLEYCKHSILFSHVFSIWLPTMIRHKNRHKNVSWSPHYALISSRKYRQNRLVEIRGGSPTWRIGSRKSIFFLAVNSYFNFHLCRKTAFEKNSNKYVGNKFTIFALVEKFNSSKIFVTSETKKESRKIQRGFGFENFTPNVNKKKSLIFLLQT